LVSTCLGIAFSDLDAAVIHRSRTGTCYASQRISPQQADKDWEDIETRRGEQTGRLEDWKTGRLEGHEGHY